MLDQAALFNKLSQTKHPLNLDLLDSATHAVLGTMVNAFLKRRIERWPDLAHVPDEVSQRVVARSVADGYYIARNVLQTVDQHFRYSTDDRDDERNQQALLDLYKGSGILERVSAAQMDPSILGICMAWSKIAGRALEPQLGAEKAADTANAILLEGVILAAMEHELFASKRLTEEKTGSGAPIYRHTESQPENFDVSQDEAAIAILEAHYEKHLGKIESVFHEIISDQVHVDVHLIKPAPGRNYWTLATTGMSDRPMTAPPGREEYRFGELIMKLPADWPVLDSEKIKDERYYWPLRWMKTLARMPHRYKTWLSYFHTIPNGDPPEPYAPGTPLCCMMLMHSELPPAAQLVDCGNGKVVRLYAVMPLHAQEMNLKMQKGAEELLQRFNKEKISMVIDPTRKNVAKSGGFFTSLFGR